MSDRATFPGGMLGMRHVALFVQDIDACLHFYVDLLGMQVEWQPDADNYYLTSGSDNLALHRSSANPAESGQRLDHIGFVMRTPADVDAWHAHLSGICSCRKRIVTVRTASIVQTLPEMWCKSSSTRPFLINPDSGKSDGDRFYCEGAVAFDDLEQPVDIGMLAGMIAGIFRMFRV